VNRICVMTLVVCLAAAGLLAQGSQPAPPRRSPEDIRAQMARLADSDAAVRALAACYLAEMRLDAAPAIETLTRLLADATLIDPVLCGRDIGPATVRGPHRSTPGLEAARALAAAGDDGAEALLAAATSPNTATRRHAIRGLTYLRDRRSLPVFLEAMRDADPAVRADAARGLGRIPRRW
jgi:HEAT repeat protein